MCCQKLRQVLQVPRTSTLALTRFMTMRSSPLGVV